jgi:DNA polymerase-3 subunit alpha (Gram-positive type)
VELEKLHQSVFVAFDLETTGFLPVKERIIELSAVKFSLDGSVYEEFDQLIDPEIPIPASATKVNGIHDEDVKGKPSIETVMDMFVDFMGEDSILLAHNSEFDSKFLGTNFILEGRELPENEIWDTLEISRALVKSIMNHKLETLVHHYGIEVSSFHRALDDSIYVMKLFREFCNQAGGYDTIRSISDVRDFSVGKDVLSVQLPLSQMKVKKAASSKKRIQFSYERMPGEVEEISGKAKVVFRGDKYNYLLAHADNAPYPEAFRLDKVTRPTIL